MKTVFNVTIGRPSASDGDAVWRLVKDVGTLDLNSAYCYIMFCDLFSETCVVAKRGDEIIGFLSAYRKPGSPDTLFVWQVAVISGMRGKGVGSGMLKELLGRKELSDIHYVEATIGPDNLSSRALFMGLIARRGGESSISERYPAELFPDTEGHEPELLFRIGPLLQREQINAI